MPKKVTRLFSQFHPVSYDLLIDVDKDKMVFNGTVIIKGRKVGRPAKRLTFHQKDLKIEAVSVIKHDKKSKTVVTINRFNSHASFDELRLHSDQMIYPGLYSISLEFSGKITPQMHGIYSSTFKHSGVDKHLVMTQFESHSAREAFPCIDEPEAKATFELKLITPVNDKVLSNTLVKNQETKNGRLITSFETTPIMSSYLLAFVIGELHGVKGQTKDGIEITSWATVAQPVHHLNYANSEAIKLMEFFSDYFKTPFPLKKLDQVAVPDFEAGAMENWGLLTFREVALLADPKNRSISSEQLVTRVVAHEVSHQWFGDLVTMRWWDDLWLNESFASIMECIGPGHLHPDWENWEDFATGTVLSCSHRDIYKDVQSVGVTVNHPDELNSIFDPSIVYAKGARLLKMLSEYIGDEAFRNGLHVYFQRHAYGNTTRHDLWQALGSVSHKNIDSFMTPWIEQSGQPRVEVNQEGNKLHLSQERFLMGAEDKTSMWPIPLLAEPSLKIDLLAKKSLSVPYTGKTWPILNVNGSGHYVVAYSDQAARDNLAVKIINRSLSSLSRIALLNDMLLLARHGEYELSYILDITNQSKNEPREAVWSMFMRVISQAQNLTDGDSVTEQHIKVYKRNLALEWYHKLGWVDKPKDDPNTKHLRSTAIALSVSGENKQAIAYALKLFNQAGSVENLPAEQRAIIAGANVRHGNKTVIAQLMKEYTSTHNPDVQHSICSALCSTRDVSVAKKLIKWGLNEGGVVRQQDIDHWFAYLMRNSYTRELAWQWLTGSWDYISKLFSDGKRMEFFIWYSSGPLSTHEWFKRYKEFFGPKVKRPSLKRNIEVAFSEIEARVKWRDREEANLREYFKAVVKEARH